MLIPVRELRLKAAWHGRRIVLAAVSGVLLTIGVAFLCAALWSALRNGFGPVVASLCLGGLFLVTALIVYLISRTPPQPHVPSLEEQVRLERAAGKPYPQPGQVVALLDAVFFGMDVYTRLRNRRR